MEKHCRCQCLKCSWIYRRFWKKEKKVLWLTVRMKASFVRRHQVGICKHVCSIVRRESGEAWEQDKEGMCEQIQREGVTQGIAWEGKRLQAQCRGTGKPGEREHERSRVVWLQQQKHFIHGGKQALMEIPETNWMFARTSFKYSWFLLKEKVSRKNYCVWNTELPSPELPISLF